MTSALRGGKTAPRLYEDLRAYNPQRLPQSQFNVLTSLPVPFDGQSLPRRVAKGACVHDWRLKERQSWPAHVAQLAAGQVSCVAAVCARCRSHLRLSISIPARGPRQRPCPQLDAPLHHFLYDFNGSEGFVWTRSEDQSGVWRAHEKFRCSLEPCQAELVIELSPPRLKQAFVDLLTDKNLITSRASAVIAADPSRFEGVAVPPVLQVLGTLRAYLQNAAKSKGEAQKINAANKRWMLSLGEPCTELLTYLGFKDAQDGFWLPPNPEEDLNVPLTDAFNQFLDDVLKELDALINSQDGQERSSQRVESVMTLAANEIRRVLGCLDYQTNPGERLYDGIEEDEHPYYAGLGAVINFHDDLLSFAYDRQQMTDPSNSPYYLQCLQGIAKGRSSESLQTKAAIEESSGRVSLDDIKSAYSALGFDVSVPADESTVIGTFQARITDAPRQEAELRRCLKVIGQHMGSRKIEDYAAESIDTYEQALGWLGATAEMGDDFITSMFSLKVNENPINVEKARHCVRVIAGKRKSDALLGFLDTGILEETEMDPSAAYELLVPGNPTSDDDLILSHYTAALSDTPGQKHELDKALRAIAKARDSPLLLSMSGGPDATAAYNHKLSEWPIGLENIGNTCYLNSLLQFFFTVKPLRSLVLGNDQYVMDITPTTIDKKKVGGRQVTRREIERAQQFIKELAVLFQEMITTPKAQITPKLELARLTMLSTFAEEGLRRQSILSDKPNFAASGIDTTQGNLSPPDDIVLVESPLVEVRTIEGHAPSTKTIVLDGDDTSEGTLVEAPLTEAMALDTQEGTVPIYEDKENVSPTKSAFDRPHTPDRSLKPLAETSPSRVNQEAREESDTNATTEQEAKHNANVSSASNAPTRPPPIPPRDRIERRTTINEEELYRQQDVTEVIGNILFQLQCAIKPDEIDPSGEQIDLIKKLFYGKMKTTTTDAAGKPRTMEEFFSDLKINVSSDPPDLYTALDSLFDRRMVELGSSEQAREEAQFSTVTMLPNVLQIHPIRTAFDRQRGAYKVNHQFVFDEVIYLDRYMDGGDPQTQQKRARCWEMKDQLKRIEERHITLGKNELGLSARETLLLTADYIRQVDELSGAELVPDVTPTLAEKVKQAADDVKSELTALSYEEEQLRTQLHAAWSDATFRTIPYRLHAVFIHRGMVSSGHYWVYILDHPHGVWRKYNDGYVTQVPDPAAEIFGKQPGDRPATPMFFVYVKESRASELVEVVRRDLPDEEPTDEQAPEIKRAATERVAEHERPAPEIRRAATDGVA